MKNMLKRTNLFLFFGAVTLLLTVYFIPEESVPPSKTAITSLITNDISHIQIYTNNEIPINLNKDNNIWHVKFKNKSEIAKLNLIQLLLKLPSSSSQQQIIATSDQLNKFGFGDNNHKIRFDSLEITFGNIEPISRLRYILIENKIHLIKDYYYPILLLPINDFLDTKNNA